jgi:hypothetical protein
MWPLKIGQRTFGLGVVIASIIIIIAIVHWATHGPDKAVLMIGALAIAYLLG